jgi:hypothetical protein
MRSPQWFDRKQFRAIQREIPVLHQLIAPQLDSGLDQTTLSARDKSSQQRSVFNTEHGRTFTILNVNTRLCMTLSIEKIHTNDDAIEIYNDWHGALQRWPLNVASNTIHHALPKRAAKTVFLCRNSICDERRLKSLARVSI